MIRHDDLAQPFTVDRYPIDCDCGACTAAEEPSLGRTCAEYAVQGAAGVLIGQLIGWALERAGVLAAIGIG